MRDGSGRQQEHAAAWALGADVSHGRVAADVQPRQISEGGIVHDTSGNFLRTWIRIGKGHEESAGIPT